MLTLQAEHVRDRPPRINKLSGLLDKLWRYVEKFEDLERKLRTIYDHVRILHLHTRLRHSRETAAAEVASERARRRAFSDAHMHTRDNHRELREEIRRVRDEAWIRRVVQPQREVQRADALGEPFAV
ncbi:uncharacterized protein PHACADRAFT_260206 [Phanerochaete carnosa HHB-10118-sp]|uniref:Uncharacterized protein n=1 Tax=Phanerochaete carnosa (strain HHB-10118-sp) TaxID=650164 RepID=K5WTG1_PHACS|nr:uncharacterized protein PHACADRAFT_260206 [Phanerochaete carnosa HHB-10118-sp]EKM53717.1 hypothetical protein PHACADRAFT_260206 [Phanerochaete carnosa HHB-10118-sp]